MNSDLKNKKILFFAPKFFGYEVDICKELESNGAIVHTYDERNNPTSIEKILLRKFPVFMKQKITNYYKKVIQDEKDFSPDVIFFISPESVTEEIMIYMKRIFKDSVFILYMYDSIENKNAKNVYAYFDKCYSFDPLDCKKYGFQFRPLFFTSDFNKVSLKKDFKYQFSFIGTLHSDRAKILNKMRKQFDEENISYFYYCYIPGKLLYIFRYLLDKNVRELSRNYVYLKSLSKQEIAEIEDESNYIIDINHPKQTGLTMRTIEMVGLQHKLLTTNNQIINYDFYNSENQFVINRECIDVSKVELTSDYKTIPDEIYNNYSLANWIKVVFEILLNG